jgi:hypothetical protein
VSTDARKAFAGTWRLVHSVEYGPGGERYYPFAEDAIGYIMYAESGVMAVQITRRGYPTKGPNPVVGKNDYLAYFWVLRVGCANKGGSSFPRRRTISGSCRGPGKKVSLFRPEALA